MKLRDNFPNTKEEAKAFGVEIRDAKGVFQIFELAKYDGLKEYNILVEKVIVKVNTLLVTNGYNEIPLNEFVKNHYDYESPDEIVSLSRHSYIEAFVLFIERE